MSYSPVVERLGFDENFMDITEMVENRLTANSNGVSFKGHVYNHLSESDLYTSTVTARVSLLNIWLMETGK